MQKHTTLKPVPTKVLKLTSFCSSRLSTYVWWIIYDEFPVILSCFSSFISSSLFTTRKEKTSPVLAMNNNNKIWNQALAALENRMFHESNNTFVRMNWNGMKNVVGNTQIFPSLRHNRMESTNTRGIAQRVKIKIEHFKFCSHGRRPVAHSWQVWLRLLTRKIQVYRSKQGKNISDQKNKSVKNDPSFTFYSLQIIKDMAAIKIWDKQKPVQKIVVHDPIVFFYCLKSRIHSQRLSEVFSIFQGLRKNTHKFSHCQISRFINNCLSSIVCFLFIWHACAHVYYFKL